MQQALPAYEIAQELGRGAFGVVYEGRHTQLGRLVAIKQLPQSFAEDDNVRERFVAEAQMVASLEHPHIVPVYDFVEHEGSRFLIMERCAGSIGDRFKEEGIVTDEACAAVLACLAALDFAHQKGLLHRDVKPENLMYDTKGVVKLADFGIARDLGADTRRTATGMIVGTPAYMSPEQCRGDDLTPASDVYSVAMMGYELLTGALPFPHTDSVNGLLAHHLVTTPAPLLQTRPELPGSVGEVIDRALAKDLGERYSTATEFATALARACVTAFGSGWLRRRRFVLHWPEIIAETERPDSNSPRTGTIMVRAGDIPHTIVSPEDQVSPAVTAPAAGDSAAAPTNMTPAAVAPPAAVAAPAAAQPIAPPIEEASTSGPNLALLAGIVAAVIAAIVGIVVLTGGSGDTEVAIPTPATSVPDQPAQDEPTNVPAATEEPAPADANTAETTPIPEPQLEVESGEAEFVPPIGPVSPDTRDEAGEDQPVVLGSDGLPIFNFLLEGADDPIVDSPWKPTPCPVEEPLVACIFGPISPDEETGEIRVAWFSLGFTPELEPVGYHLHFYIPELVDGDETRAGTAAPGGAWRQWDDPSQAMSFNGENGRTLYTLADFRQAGSNTLCVLVATPDNEVIPGTGNCAPVPAVDDDGIYRNMVNRIEGQWAGNCSARAMAILPADWRWHDLTVETPAEVAAIIRPTDVASATQILEEIVADGGVIWSEGPVVDDFIVNMALSVVPGEFGLTDSPAQVAETIERLGFSINGFERRQVQGRNVLFGIEDQGEGVVSGVYLIPDSGYVIAMTFTAPSGAGLNDLADQIAYSVQGC